MKILICGKGGSGKSTLSVLIARSLKNRGYRVLLVDADESNSGLHRLMDISSPVILTDHFGGKKGAKNKMEQAFSKSPFGLDISDDQKWKIADIPKNCVTTANGITLLTVGKIHHFGAGCACAMGAMSKMFLANLELEKDEFVIVDTEAGVEHFGRRVEEGCDMIIGLVDPSFESFMLAEKIREMSKNAQTDVFFVLNKVEEQVKEVMYKHIASEKVIAEIPKTDEIFMASLEGEALKTDLSETERISEFIESRVLFR